MKARYYTAITCRKNLLRQKPVAFMVICEIILNSKKKYNRQQGYNVKKNGGKMYLPGNVLNV